jgi:hypothetical protein
VMLRWYSCHCYYGMLLRYFVSDVEMVQLSLLLRYIMLQMVQLSLLLRYVAEVFCE